MNPDISVIMSVRNGERFLAEAIESVLGQTAGNFEFIVIDDASTDRTPEILDRYAKADKRLLLLANPKHFGLPRSLNIALTRAKGDFVARQDADDISCPDRFQKQLAVFSRESSLGILGSSVTAINEEGNELKLLAAPTHDTVLRWQMLFRNVFKHASVMLRHDVLKTNRLRYDEGLPYAQDYDLWSRVLWCARGANLKEPLVRYRIHKGQISTAHSDRQQKLADRVGRRNVRRLGIDLDEDRYARLRRWTRNLPSRLSRSDMGLCSLYFELLGALEAVETVDPNVVSSIRKHLVRHLMRAASIRDVRDLWASGLLRRLVESDFREVGSSLLRRFRHV